MPLGAYMVGNWAGLGWAGVLSFSSMLLFFLAGMVWVFKTNPHACFLVLCVSGKDFRGAWNKRVKHNSLGSIPLLRHVCFPDDGDVEMAVYASNKTAIRDWKPTTLGRRCISVKMRFINLQVSSSTAHLACFHSTPTIPSNYTHPSKREPMTSLGQYTRVVHASLSTRIASL